MAEQLNNEYASWPENGLETVVHCPVCAAEDRTILHSGLTDEIFRCAAGEWTLFRCAECGCGYLDPRPNEATIHLAYQTYYTHQPTSACKVPISRLRRFKMALANGYMNRKFGTAAQPSSQLGVIAAAVIPALRTHLNARFRNLPPPGKDASLLDVGFGSGEFLEWARDAGWAVAGVDPDEKTVTAARARGLNVRRGSVEVLFDMPESFDVITLSHVIEHVHDPRGLVERAARLLKPGGAIWIETPNVDSSGLREFGRHWRGLEPPRHLVLFTWHALEKMLRDAGLTPDKRLVRSGVYKNLAAKSRAIAQGEDPYKAAKPSVRDRFKDQLISWQGSFNRGRTSEFITILAHKDRQGEKG